MDSACGGYRPNERPAIGVEHRQGPQITIRTGHPLMQEGPDRIQVRVAMRDHHTLRTRGSAAGVVDGQQITLKDFRSSKSAFGFSQQRFVIKPVNSGTGILPVIRDARATLSERDEVLNTR